MFIISGVLGVGSGGHYAQGNIQCGENNIMFDIFVFRVAAALALIDIDDLEAEAVARKAMRIAGDMCVYTNHNLTVEILDPSAKKEEVKTGKKEDSDNSA
jgi:ATP-dependent protease HslVU (ClpYQ) peptidase subunit